MRKKLLIGGIIFAILITLFVMSGFLNIRKYFSQSTRSEDIDPFSSGIGDFHPARLFYYQDIKSTSTPSPSTESVNGTSAPKPIPQYIQSQPTTLPPQSNKKKLSLPSSKNTLVAGTVYDVVTQTPVPGITVAVAQSSEFAETNVEGRFSFQWYETNGSTYDLYVPARAWYLASELARIVADGNKHELTFQISPKPADPGETVLFPKATYIPSERTQLHGRIVDGVSGKGIEKLPIAFSGSSVHGKTDVNGFFTIDFMLSSTQRMYFPTLSKPNYYQVNILKGYVASLKDIPIK